VPQCGHGDASTRHTRSHWVADTAITISDGNIAHGKDLGTIQTTAAVRYANAKRDAIVLRRRSAAHAAR
jgi:hypothetical protein